MFHGIRQARASRHDYVSQIEVNVSPRADDVLKSEVEETEHDQDDQQAVGTPKPNVVGVSQWAIFSQDAVSTGVSMSGIHISPDEADSKQVDKCTSSEHGTLAKNVSGSGLVADKLLLLPYEVLNRLHRSHIAQLDELWTLKTLHQKRQLNVQKWQFLKEKLQEVRPKAEELSSSLSKIEEASSSLSRQRSGIRVKKLQRTAGVARDLALKCRMAQARKSLLVRLARQLGGDAFADGKCRVFALAFEVKNHESVEWNADVCKVIREALQKKMTDIGTCCASWDADCQQLILYFCNCSHTFEATMATRNPDSTSEIESILEQALNKSAESPELKTSFKELHKLHAAEIETPLDLNHLGAQSHGMDGSALNIDWVAPGSWADVFGLKMDDVVVLANHCPTAEIGKNHVSLDSENSHVLLFVVRGG